MQRKVQSFLGVFQIEVLVSDSRKMANDCQAELRFSCPSVSMINCIIGFVSPATPSSLTISFSISPCKLLRYRRVASNVPVLFRISSIEAIYGKFLKYEPYTQVHERTGGQSNMRICLRQVIAYLKKATQ
ncbi:hypothetical protein ACMFMF_011700 [Clarireedia jacksonii]